MMISQLKLLEINLKIQNYLNKKKELKMELDMYFYKLPKKYFEIKKQKK
jgi:hypothetical protein